MQPVGRFGFHIEIRRPLPYCRHNTLYALRLLTAALHSFIYRRSGLKMLQSQSVERRHFMREPCSDAGFGGEKLASRAISFHIHTQEIVGRLSVYTYYIMERIYYICVFI